MSDHAAPGSLELIPVTGLPEFREGDDLVSALAAAAPWLRDGDVLVVTSKIFSKIEGRLVAAPDDPAERETLRRKLVEAESTRVLARIRNTRITQNRLGIVQAASGVDASNVSQQEIALLPEDPDGSAAALRAALRERLGVEVAVVVTDTMGRTWRLGQTDAAIGSSGVTVLHSYEGSVDSHGNELVVTQVAVADEIAGAADLVKGKLGGTGAAVLRGAAPRDDGSRAADLVRPVEEDLFSLGTAEAVAKGRREAVLLRRSVREFRDQPVEAATIRHAVGVALTAPAPHHTRPVRFVWLRDRERRAELLDAMREAWIADLVASGMPRERAVARTERGRLLYTAPELLIPFLVPDGAHQYPDERRTAAEHTMFMVAAGAAVQGLLVALTASDVDSCWVGSTIFAPDVARYRLGLPGNWEPLGAIAAGYPVSEEPREPRPPRDLAEGLVEL